MGNPFGNGNVGSSAVKIGLREGKQAASLGLRLRLWWNWQTRYFEVVVGQPVQVQVLLSAPSLNSGCNLQITLTIPDEIARHWGESPEAIGRSLMEAAAINAYRTGHL